MPPGTDLHGQGCLVEDAASPSRASRRQAGEPAAAALPAARRRHAAGDAARPCAGLVSHLLLEVATDVLPGSAAAPFPGDIGSVGASVPGVHGVAGCFGSMKRQRNGELAATAALHGGCTCGRGERQRD